MRWWKSSSSSSFLYTQTFPCLPTFNSFFFSPSPIIVYGEEEEVKYTLFVPLPLLYYPSPSPYTDTAKPSQAKPSQASLISSQMIFLCVRVRSLSLQGVMTKPCVIDVESFAAGKCHWRITPLKHFLSPLFLLLHTTAN